MRALVTRRTSWTIVGVLAFAAAESCMAKAVHREAGEPERINLNESEAAKPHPIGLDDILDLRAVQAPSLSPDGRWLAFVVRQAFLDCNCYRSALYVMSAGSVPERATLRKLVEEAAISNLRWTPDSRFLTYLSTRDGSQQVWRVSRTGGVPDRLFVHTPGMGQTFHETLNNPRDTARVGVERYEWAPDGHAIAYTTQPAADPDTLRAMADAGIRYDDDRMWGFDIVRQQWTREPTELWVYDVHGRHSRLLWRAPEPASISSAAGSDIQGLAWSPDAKRIAISYATGTRSTADGYLRYDLGVVDTQTGAFATLVARDSMAETEPVWSPDGTRIAFSSGVAAVVSFDPSMSSLALGVVTAATKHVRYVARGRIGYNLKLWWSSDSTVAALNAYNAGHRRRRWGIQQVDLTTGAVERLTPGTDFISDCGDLVNGRVACVHQNSNVPPAVATVDLTTRAIHDVVDVNAKWDSTVLRSPVTEIRWRNCFGAETNGYLVRPYDAMRGKRYPLLVMLYGFQGSFVTTAEQYITSWPVQMFAREGFVVLLWNYPRLESWQGDSFRRGAMTEADNALASLQAAIHVLTDSGFVDPDRVGILGWSHGGFATEYALSHSSLFRAASLLNGGDYTPATDWFLGSFTRTIDKKYFAGPPFGPTLANWVAISPFFSANRVRAPVLMEYDTDEAIIGLEMFVALHESGVPAEFYIYPNDGHVLMQPVHRMVSMQRNLDWFSFWLLGRAEPDAAKTEQYRRWRAMRQQLRRLPRPDVSSRSACDNRPIVLDSIDRP